MWRWNWKYGGWNENMREVSKICKRNWQCGGRNENMKGKLKTYRKNRKYKGRVGNMGQSIIPEIMSVICSNFSQALKIIYCRALWAAGYYYALQRVIQWKFKVPDLSICADPPVRVGQINIFNWDSSVENTRGLLIFPLFAFVTCCD